MILFSYESAFKVLSILFGNQGKCISFYHQYAYMMITETFFIKLNEIIHNNFPIILDLIIHKFDELKTQGNSAKTKENYDEALRKYDEALSVAQMSPALYKKAAIIYNNKANVLFAQKKYDEALDNALAAVNSDECYVKVWNHEIIIIILK